MLFQMSRIIPSYFGMAEVLDLVIKDDLGLSDSNDGVDASEGIYAYLGKPETNNLDKFSSRHSES